MYRDTPSLNDVELEITSIVSLTFLKKTILCMKDFLAVEKATVVG